MSATANPKPSDEAQREAVLCCTDLLGAVGFIRGTDFDGEVWTNVDSEWMTQVWVYLSGEPGNFKLNYDGRKNFDFGKFFKWWEEISRDEYYEGEAQAEMGDSW